MYNYKLKSITIISIIYYLIIIFLLFLQCFRVFKLKIFGCVKYHFCDLKILFHVPKFYIKVNISHRFDLTKRLSAIRVWRV